jgi:predicted DNA-binding protein (UPF0251 family)
MDPRCFNATEVTVTQVEVMELTPEEVEMIKKQRAEKARRSELDKQFEILEKTLKRIYELKGEVTLPYIGGKYISGHRPGVKPTNITCRY